MSEDDNLDMSDLDRSVGGSSVTTDVVENFVASSLSSYLQNESEMDRPDEPTSTSNWGLGKLTGFMKRLVGETPITNEELTPVIDSLKKKVRLVVDDDS